MKILFIALRSGTENNVNWRHCGKLLPMPHRKSSFPDVSLIRQGYMYVDVCRLRIGKRYPDVVSLRFLSM